MSPGCQEGLTLRTRGRAAQHVSEYDQSTALKLFCCYSCRWLCLQKFSKPRSYIPAFTVWSLMSLITGLFKNAACLKHLCPLCNSHGKVDRGRIPWAVWAWGKSPGVWVSSEETLAEWGLGRARPVSVEPAGQENKQCRLWRWCRSASPLALLMPCSWIWTTCPGVVTGIHLPQFLDAHLGMLEPGFDGVLNWVSKFWEKSDVKCKDNHTLSMYF